MIDGVIRRGVEHGVVVLHADDGVTWQLLGSVVPGLRTGSRARVTGRPDDRPMAGTAQQGRRLLVSAVTDLGDRPGPGGPPPGAAGPGDPFDPPHVPTAPDPQG